MANIKAETTALVPVKTDNEIVDEILGRANTPTVCSANATAVTYLNGTKTVTYKSKGYYSSDFKAPIKDILEYNSATDINEWGYRDIVAIEHIKGKSFSVHFDGKNVVFKNHNNDIVQKGDDYLGFKEIFYNRYAKEFVKMVGHLKKVPFTLHGIIVGNDADSTIQYFKNKEQIDIMFYDIYINTNWMDWDDFSYLMKLYKMQMVPLLYSGEFPGKETLYRFANKPNVYGIIVRPSWEDTLKSKRLITKFTNNKFKPMAKENIDELRGAVRIYMFQEFVHSAVLWDAELTAKGIEKTKKNISKIMKLISKRGMEDIDTFLVSEFYLEQNGKYTVDQIRTAMKRELSSIIKIELGLNNLKK